jgi:hypothetical protein
MGALFTAVVGWLVRTVLVKFVTFTVLYVIVSAFVSYVMGKLSGVGPAALNSALSTWTPAMWYFADLTLFSQGIPAIICAYVLRFAIRRLPIIG